MRPGALPFPAVLGQSVALISPTMTAVLIIPLAFASAGEGTWAAYLFGTIMLLFVVLCLNQFAKRSAAPGAMYTYIARGLGPANGGPPAGPCCVVSCSSAPLSPPRSSPSSTPPLTT